MKNSRVVLLILLCVLLIAGAGILSADEAKPDVTPVISRPGALVFKDDFGKAERDEFLARAKELLASEGYEVKKPKPTSGPNPTRHPVKTIERDEES